MDETWREESERNVVISLWRRYLRENTALAATLVTRSARPMNPEGSITRWFRQVQAGNAEGVQHLWERYCARLQGLARKRLGGWAFGVADSEDVALSAFYSLCQGLANGCFPSLQDRDNLWRLLIVITSRKTAHLIRDERAQKRGGGAAIAHDSPVDELELTISEELTPEFLAQAAEEYRRLLDLLGRDDLRDVARWKMEGYSHQEIAEKMDCATRSVDRKLRLIRDLWEGELG